MPEKVCELLSVPTVKRGVEPLREFVNVPAPLSEPIVRLWPATSNAPLADSTTGVPFGRVLKLGAYVKLLIVCVAFAPPVAPVKPM